MNAPDLTGDEFDDDGPVELTDDTDIDVWHNSLGQVTLELIDDAGRHLRRLERRLLDINNLAAHSLQNESARIEQWRLERVGTLPEQIEQTINALQTMGAAYLEGKREKTVFTPNVKISTRTTTKWDWPADMTKIVEWAKVLKPELVNYRQTITETVDKTAVKKIAQRAGAGAVIDGEWIPDVLVFDDKVVIVEYNDTNLGSVSVGNE
jgi:hypothetical protein